MAWLHLSACTYTKLQLQTDCPQDLGSALKKIAPVLAVVDLLLNFSKATLEVILQAGQFMCALHNFVLQLLHLLPSVHVHHETCQLQQQELMSTRNVRPVCWLLSMSILDHCQRTELQEGHTVQKCTRKVENTH